MTQENARDKVQLTVGLDVGSARIGVAVSDSDANFAVPKATLKSVQEVADFLVEEEPVVIVVGWPLELSGNEGRATKTVDRFIASVSEHLDFDVEWVRWDERLTTTESTHLLREAGKNAKEQRAVIDQLAATKILQSYLDAESNREQ